ncbi:MAG: patatin-like phospholipase family protein [Ruminococcus sp.]|nr:patatin-like phospholipase family protein [Ruminococcus sp.]
MSERIGLVLSGGGAKGAYEIGVYKALSAIGATRFIDVIAGTSVGALNAVLLESRGAEYSENVWHNLKLSDMLNLDVKRIAKNPLLVDYNSPDYVGIKPDNVFDSIVLKSMGLISFMKKENPLTDFLKHGLPVNQDKISEIIDKNVDFNNIYRKIYVTCSDSYGDIKYFHLNHYRNELKKKIILASSALPVIYTGVAGGIEINGEYYSDGGIKNESNTPVPFIYDNGCRSIIAVHLKYDADITNQYRMKDADIINIIPSRDLGDFVSGTLNLNPLKVKSDIELGYNDTINKTREIYAMINKVKLKSI